ncbi:MAG: hypothetical protein Q7V31_07040 [Parvibaculum sp.]|uniref:hypothetical protein n=1 Tax=Parvibaculum sp. TaxID=2024848 RepID=UPI00272625E1|nr:hypothetical protein [Parvibaculum sp.]MDO8838669.1 hypothetical protein [Parvibaculum sp.]
MEFRLTYQGCLLSTGNDSRVGKDRRSEHKHNLRSAFHPQLKRLWDVVPALKKGGGGGPSVITVRAEDGYTPPLTKKEMLAKRHTHFGWQFVPLVTSELDLICAVDVLFLRPHKPGGIVHQGDIDGRLKTLLDALTIPDANQDYETRTAERNETPFFVLLENDRLITKVSVETDQLLEFVSAKPDVNDVRLVITVRIRPYEIHTGNMHFG